MSGWEIIAGDCLDGMAGMPAESVDSVVCDPPYGLTFMGKNWDHGVPGVAFWEAALRVAKPGAHLVAFGGTRTHHRLMCAIEDAGWEVRDVCGWLYGSGFPKSLDVSKAVGRKAGGDARAPWAGWGTALKPAWEPIILARKPLAGTVAENVLRFGTVGINVDGCRVGTESTLRTCNGQGQSSSYNLAATAARRVNGATKGRWPANVLHDGSAEVMELFPQTGNGFRPNPSKDSDDGSNTWRLGREARGERGHNDAGSAGRFFYCAKASKADRDAGCEGFEERDRAGHFGQCHAGTSAAGNVTGNYLPRRNHHPTVKPTSLMRYLVRLVTRPGGLVLDPFMGSGSTGKAALLEGCRFVGCEREADYCEIARARLAAAEGEGN